MVVKLFDEKIWNFDIQFITGHEDFLTKKKNNLI